MKFALAVISIGILAYFGASFGPWWSGALAALIVTAFGQLRAGEAFLAGFIALALVWGISAAIIDARNTGILSERVGQLFGGLSGVAMIAITALTGAILGGLAGMTGSYGMSWLVSKK